MKIFNIKFWQYCLFYSRIEKLLNTNKFSEAIKSIENYLQNKRYSTVDIYYLLGKAHYENKNYEKTIKSFQAFLAQNTEKDVYKANTLFYLGLAYYDSGDFNNAINVFNEAIMVKKDTKIKALRDVVISLPHIYCFLGKTYLKLDEKQKAFAAFNEGLKYEPNNEALQRELTLLGIG